MIIIIIITVCLKYHKQKQKEIYNETIDHGRVTEILQIYHDKFIYLNTSINEFFKNIGFIYYIGFILHTIQKYIIWVKALLGNKLNDFCLETLCLL